MFKSCIFYLGGSNTNTRNKFSKHLKEHSHLKSKVIKGFSLNFDTDNLIISGSDTSLKFKPTYSKPFSVYAHLTIQRLAEYLEVSRKHAQRLFETLNFADGINSEETELRVSLVMAITALLKTVFDQMRASSNSLCEQLSDFMECCFGTVQAIFQLLILQVRALQELNALKNEEISLMEERTSAMFMEIIHQAVTVDGNGDQINGALEIHEVIHQTATLVQNDPEMLDDNWTSLEDSTHAILQKLEGELNEHGGEYRKLVDSITTFEETKYASLLNVVGRTIALKLGIELQKLSLLEETAFTMLQMDFSSDEELVQFLHKKLPIFSPRVQQETVSHDETIDFEVIDWATETTCKTDTETEHQMLIGLDKLARLAKGSPKCKAKKKLHDKHITKESSTSSNNIVLESLGEQLVTKDKKVCTALCQKVVDRTCKTDAEITGELPSMWESEVFVKGSTKFEAKMKRLDKHMSKKRSTSPSHVHLQNLGESLVTKAKDIAVESTTSFSSDSVCEKVVRANDFEVTCKTRVETRGTLLTDVNDPSISSNCEVVKCGKSSTKCDAKKKLLEKYIGKESNTSPSHVYLERLSESIVVSHETIASSLSDETSVYFQSPSSDEKCIASQCCLATEVSNFPIASCSTQSHVHHVRLGEPVSLRTKGRAVEDASQDILVESTPCKKKLLIETEQPQVTFTTESVEKLTVRDYMQQQHSDCKKQLLLQALEENIPQTKPVCDVKFPVTKTQQALSDATRISQFEPSSSDRASNFIQHPVGISIQPPLSDEASVSLLPTSLAVSSQQSSAIEASTSIQLPSSDVSLQQLLTEIANCPPKLSSDVASCSIQRSSENCLLQLLKLVLMVTVFCTNSTSMEAENSSSEEMAKRSKEAKLSNRNSGLSIEPTRKAWLCSGYALSDTNSSHLVCECFLGGSSCSQFFLDNSELSPQTVINEHFWLADNKLFMPMFSSERKSTQECKAKTCDILSSLMNIVTSCSLCDTMSSCTVCDDSKFTDPQNFISCSGLHYEASNAVHCRSKIRIKRARQVPPSKQLHTLKKQNFFLGIKSNKTVQFVKQPVIHSDCNDIHTVVRRTSLCRGKKGMVVKRVANLLSMAETSSDYSKSKMVNASCFLDKAVHISKVLKTHSSELTRLSSHSQCGQTSSGHSGSLQLITTTSQQLYSSQYQVSNDHYHKHTDLTSDQTTAGTSDHSPNKIPAEISKSELLMKGHGSESNRQSVNKAKAGNGSQLCYDRSHSKESDFEVQHSTSRRPDWISVVTDLLHVPDYPKMIQRLDSETPTTDHFASHRFIRGIANFKIGNFQQAMSDLSEGERYAQETDQRGGVSLCNVYLGDLYYSSGSHSEAAKCYQKAAEYYDTDNIAKLFRMVAPTVSAIHAKCGSCFRTLSKSVEAIQEYKKAIEASAKDKDRLTAHTSLGNLYQSSGQNNEALKEYEQALELAQKLNDNVSIVWTHGNLGNAYLGLSMKDKALFHLQKALDLAVKYEPTPSAIGRAYNNIGTAYQSMGDLDKAEEHYDLALSQAIYGNDPAGQARVYGNIADNYIVRKMFEKAIPHYTEVLRLSTDEAAVTGALFNRGCAYYEWAESKMIALEKSSSNNNLPACGIIFRIHGSKAVSHEHSPRIVIDSVYKLYKQGKEDLEKVLALHERKYEESAERLSLIVPWLESNYLIFHRLQDCMVNLGNWREALLVAEQCKARTLGEMMLANKGSQLDHPLTSPLNLKQVYNIIISQSSPVLYLSYTGTSILGWVLIPIKDNIFMEMFEVPLADDQFDGKSFDYHTRYSLTEILIEQSYEMYCSVEYSEEYTAPAVTLYELIGRPLQAILKKAKKLSTPQKIVLVTDTYTALLPFACFYDPESKTFLGDSFYFEIGLSFLTMGIMNQLPEPIVELPADPQNMCIIGNPTIPQFYHSNEVWSLGKLPDAKREAQWVGHILGTPPILDEQATKEAILMRFVRAKMIHIATHGSSVSGFLAFSAPTSTREGEVVDSRSVLLHPEEVEKLSINPALVVLSSCDSARGTVKADGIQGMARAFILAGEYLCMFELIAVVNFTFHSGAQAVLTALWRLPDESAAIFMRFFYRFLGEGLESSLALQKSILSLRCFAKYSQYIHWSGYQLTGRSVRFDVSSSPVTTILDNTLGQSSAFPRLMLVKKLQSVLVEIPTLPTDIQV